MIIPLILGLSLATKSVAHTLTTISDKGPERALVHVQNCKGLPQPIFEDRRLVVPTSNVFWTDTNGQAVYFSPTSYLIETIDFRNGDEAVIRNCPYKK